ncbi:EAL domain-containing protein [Paenibacillus kobensis]|uniref:EAL domain-containing protein n=1 Tax=Paenibacillus kobensis TaxID=59841 RepID=UPI0013E398E9|nr:EAL domain-containing protein [Paenibacillus kobensis]
MNNQIRVFKSLWTTILYLALGLMAYVSYSFPIQLFFGISFSLGSALLFLAASWFGWRAGMLLLAAVHGLLMVFHEPTLALGSLTLEVISVITLASRWPRLGLIGGGAVYWLLLGTPIHYVTNADAGIFSQETLFFAYTMISGGLCNALIAELIASYLPPGIFGHGRVLGSRPLRFSQALVHITIFAMLGSSILFIVSGGQSFQQTIMREINNKADMATQSVQNAVKLMSPADQRGIRLNGYLEQAKMKRLLHNVLASDPYEAVLVLPGGAELLHTAVGTEEMPEWLEVNNWQGYFAERKMWSPTMESNSGREQSGSQWKQMSFIYPIPLGTFDLFVRVPLDTYRNEVYSVYNAQMMSCLYVTAIVAMFALLIYRFFVSGIRRLTVVSEGIPDKVKAGIAPEWPQSKLEEINSLVGNFRVVTEKLGAMFMESREQAYFDTLTGLPNRRHFNEHLQSTLDEAYRDQDVHVVFIDLDRFKHINDTLGHAVGDLLLQQVSYRLIRTVGDRAFIARLGGDEFVLISVQGRNTVREVADELLDIMELPFQIGNEELYVTLSMGISSSTISGKDAETIVKNADFAMYEAKGAGGCGYRFYSPPDTDLSKQMRLEFELRKAVDRQQLQLYYMPIYDKAGEKLVSIEALLRWFHPEFGFVSPASFIPIAESCGLLKPIGEWVASAACRQLKDWLDQGYEPVPVAINLSPTQIQLHGIVGYLEKLLEETGTPPALLEVEITEEVFAKQPERVIAELHRLKRHGMKVWIDDFGTGYSSLGMLNRLPVDGFKIDRTFVKGLHTDSDKLSIIETMMLLSKSRNWLVVAEGVETIGESQALSDIGCRLQQGYYYGQAVPASEIVSWFPQKTHEPSGMAEGGSV